MKKQENSFRGLTFFTQSYDDLLQIINKHIENKENCFISTPTTEIIGESFNDAKVVEILESATILLPDSVTLVQLASVLGKKIRHRLTGVDTIYKLGQNKDKKYRVYLLGSREDVVKKAAEEAKQLLPSFEVVGYQSGYFQSKDESGIVEEINKSQADILFVGMGFPKQELFIYNNLATLKVPVKITVGGSFDVVSGMLKRAPRWMQSLGLEWLFRLIQEPSRITRMALIPYFLLQIFIYELVHTKRK